MSNFKEFRAVIQEKFDEMSKNVDSLFETDVDKDEMWNLYLDSFPAEANPIYRERREHDCSCCRHFVKTIGNVVSLKDGVLTSIWDVRIDDPAYQTVADALSAYVKSKPIANAYHVVDMKQYCRYCSYLVYGDWPYCEKKEKLMSEATAKRANTCKDFELNPIDAFGENEKGYQPRRAKTPEEIETKKNQVSFL